MPNVPRSLVFSGLILVSLSLVPLACIVRNWNDPQKESTRIQIIPDMDTQPKLSAQATSGFFEDGRAARPWPEGTVARGLLRADDPYFRGMSLPDSTDTAVFPRKVTESLLARGQERYDIFCATCHGLGGRGDGMTSLRADALEQGTWVPPSDLATPTVIGRPHGHIYRTITQGYNNMPGYGSQIPPDDRWAIVAYVRALQRARNATMDDVPEDHRRNLR